MPLWPISERLPEGDQRARGRSRCRRAYRSGAERIPDGRFHPKHDRRSSLEEGRNPGRPAGGQPQCAEHAERRRRRAPPRAGRQCLSGRYRSVYRKVIKERAAVLAADAPTEVGQSESLMGASIRSTIGVPLWKKGEILGVLQADNRNAPSMLNAGDVELLLVLAANASLADIGASTGR